MRSTKKLSPQQEAIAQKFIVNHCKQGSKINERILSQNCPLTKRQSQKILLNLHRTGLLRETSPGYGRLQVESYGLDHIHEAVRTICDKEADLIRTITEKGTDISPLEFEQEEVYRHASALAKERNPENIQDLTYAYLLADQRFHTAFAEAAERPLAIDVLQNSYNILLLSFANARLCPGELQELSGEHEEILQMLRSRSDAGTISRVLRGHYKNTLWKYSDFENAIPPSIPTEITTEI